MWYIIEFFIALYIIRLKTNFHFIPIITSGPFSQAVTSHMLLKNPTDQTILFKIKTTAPKRYCVRPNSGVLEAHSSLEVSSKSLLIINNNIFSTNCISVVRIYRSQHYISFQFVYNHLSSIPMKNTDISSWFKVLLLQMAITMLMLW